jgi:hypothetical protein
MRRSIDETRDNSINNDICEQIKVIIDIYVCCVNERELVNVVFSVGEGHLFAIRLVNVQWETREPTKNSERRKNLDKRRGNRKNERTSQGLKHKSISVCVFSFFVEEMSRRQRRRRERKSIEHKANASCDHCHDVLERKQSGRSRERERRRRTDTLHARTSHQSVRGDRWRKSMKSCHRALFILIVVHGRQTLIEGNKLKPLMRLSLTQSNACEHYSTVVFCSGNRFY